MNYAEKIVPIFILPSVAFLVSVDITVMIFAEAVCSSRVIILFFFFPLLEFRVHNVGIF